MPSDSPRASRVMVAFAGVALVWVSAEAPRRIVAALGGRSLAENRAERARLEDDYRGMEERRRFALRLIQILIDEEGTLPDMAAALTSTQTPDSQVAAGVRRRFPGQTPAGRSAANLIELTFNEMIADTPRRREVVGRLLAEYRREYGEYPPPLRELADRVSRDEGLALTPATPAGDMGS